MRLRVKLFAFLARFRGNLPAGTPFEVELPDGATLADLLRLLQVPAQEVKMTFVNGLAQAEDWPLKDGDEVGVFPPIAGG
jgi:molybdopterin converting factor small subunit